MTDEPLVYERLGKEFAGHGTINHSADEYVRTGGFHHTNTAEGFFSEAHLHPYWPKPTSSTTIGNYALDVLRPIKLEDLTES